MQNADHHPTPTWTTCTQHVRECVCWVGWTGRWVADVTPPGSLFLRPALSCLASCCNWEQVNQGTGSSVPLPRPTAVQTMWNPATPGDESKKKRMISFPPCIRMGCLVCHQFSSDTSYIHVVPSETRQEKNSRETKPSWTDGYRPWMFRQDPFPPKSAVIGQVCPGVSQMT